MPLYERQCVNGHRADEFVHTNQDLGARTMLCSCGCTMGRMLSVGKGLCYFEEGRGRWIENLGPEPTYITSHEQHKREMKKHRVEWATKGRGIAGQWS